MLLEVTDLVAGYGKIDVLHGVTLHVAAGEVVSLLGPNGAGKTTLLGAISGLIPVTSGTVRFDGNDMKGASARHYAKAGLAHVIEGHRIFSQLTVTDNLLLAGYDLSRHERTERIETALSLFPEISAKRDDKGGALSGGQQQMLAIAQSVVRNPKLLLLDEPSAGLSPVLVDRVLTVVSELKAAGTAVLLVEQLVDKAVSVSDRIYALAQGHMVVETSADTSDLHHRLEAAYFGG
ncbi:ABC transporter ATP-binding protein [Acuticoccus yangtzensis]|uniref:ABC transporter ATP-binding protein n=1 Tax=Acuticoccus yangtzensis TaxID=1443441 RepID=UPI0009498DFC|nr:ABC transporter ATP-binding protein [Acuticoccus yangtzensis]ORE90902.1 branched-chain amino acid ABC transporter ATPase [Stappia sp. 22II-S9-Z10]